MGTIVKFKPDIDYYYSRGLHHYESDNFFDALKSYREAYNLINNAQGDEFRSILEMEMACCYRNLNLMRETQLMYYKSLCTCSLDASFDAIMGLIDVFGTSNNEEALKYYMDLAARKGFSREFDYIEAAQQFYSQLDYRVEPTPEQNMFDFGRKLLEAGQYEFARQMLEVIPSDSPMRADACVHLAALYNSAGEHERALAYADEAVRYGKTDETLVNRVLALYKLGRQEEFEEALQELAETDTEDIAALAQYIRAAAILENGDLVIKFGRKLFMISPQKNPMLCYALALANKGELREARKIMVTLQALYPYDAMVRVFSVRVSRLTDKGDFSLSCEVPEAVEEEILSELNGILSECDNDRTALKAKLCDPRLHTAVLMILQVGSENSKKILADIVAEIPYYEEYIRDCLMDPGCSDADKRLLLPIALRRFRHRPVFLTCRDICRPLFGKAPSRINFRWREVYYLAYSTLAMFGCEDFEREFDTAFAKIYDALCEEREPDQAAAAALTVQRTKRVSALSDDECCIELFGADKETFKQYKKLLHKK